MKYLIFPLTKNPAFGRFGPVKMQDWYRTCVRAVSLERQLITDGNEAEIIVLADVHYKGYRHETEYYTEALMALGAKNVRTIKQCYETIGQIEFVIQLATKEQSKLIVISTFAHYLRAARLLKGRAVYHHIAFGLPRISELATDAILTFLFPVLDLMGGREWFKNKVIARRKTGKP